MMFYRGYSQLISTTNFGEGAGLFLRGQFNSPNSWKETDTYQSGKEQDQKYQKSDIWSSLKSN